MKKPVFLDIPETFQSELDLVNIRRYWARIKTSSLHVSVTRRFSKYIFIPDLSCGEEKSSCLSVGDLFQDKCTSSGLRTERWTVRAGWILTRYYILILLTKLPSITKIIIVYSVSFWIVTSCSSSFFPQFAWGAAKLKFSLYKWKAGNLYSFVLLSDRRALEIDVQSIVRSKPALFTSDVLP